MTVLLLFPTNQNNLQRWCTGATGLGIDLAVVEYSKWPLCYPAWVGPVFQHGRTTDDPNEILPLTEGLDLTGVAAYSEQAVLLAHRMAARLGLPHNTRLQPESVRDKTLMRETLRRAGLPQPRTLLTTTAAIPASDLRGARFPVVVKPVDGVGSFGVTLCHNADDAVAAVSEIVAADPFAAGGWTIGNTVTVEEFVAGPDYSCDVIVLGGRVAWAGITSHVKNSGPDFDDIGHCFPGRTMAPASAVHEMAQRAVTGLGIDDGVCHIEFRESYRGPVIIEVANRVPAGGIPQIIEWVTGVRLEESALAIAAGIGRVARNGSGRCRYAGARMHFASHPAITFPDGVTLVESIVHTEPHAASDARPTAITELVGMSVVCGDRESPIMEWLRAGVTRP